VIDLILFDLDGTLIDHRSAVLAAIGQIVQKAPGACLPADDLVAMWWALERTHMRRYLAGECSFAEQRRSRLREFFPLLGEPVPGDTDLDAWFSGRYLPLFEAAWTCYPDVIPSLQGLAERARPPRRAVLTNGDLGQQRDKLVRLGLLEYFETVLTPAHLGAAKPDPAAFATACGQLGVSPRQVLSVGDWLEGDVIAATRAGLAGIWLDRGVEPFTGEVPVKARTVAAEMALIRIEDLGGLAAAL
jgi:putative hydrolase of the HAD superfamily